MTLITLFVSKYGTYSIDAVFGIIISIIITVSAIRQVISSAKILVNYVPYAVREKVEESFPDAKYRIIYITTPEGIEAFIKADVSGADMPASADKCFNETGVKIHIIKGE